MNKINLKIADQLTRTRVPRFTTGLTGISQGCCPGAGKIERSAEALRDCHIPISFPSKSNDAYKTLDDLSIKVRKVANIQIQQIALREQQRNFSQ